MTMIREKSRCEGYVRGDQYSSNRCPNTAKVEREGKRFCLRHDPLLRRIRATAKELEWKRQWEESRRRAEEAKIAELRRVFDAGAKAILGNNVPVSKILEVETLFQEFVATERKEGRL